MNGRSISAARWNKPLFFKPTSSSDFTPDKSVHNGLQVPDWVLVTRNGTNVTATTLPTTAIMRGRYTGTATADGSVVVGRYAYNIYNEGGLLDANVAGYPSPTPVQSATPYPEYKLSEAFADLSQVFTAGGSGTNANKYAAQLVAWRNYSSIQDVTYKGAASTAGTISSTYPNFSFDANGASAYTYYNYVLQDTSGAKRAANLSLSSTGQSDHRFSSRQQLLSFLTNLSSTDTTQLNAPQYLTTFSRGLEQPSFVPSSSRPKVTTIATGGNDSVNGDDVINPSFLTARATTSFTRNNGTSAQIGDPLVKRRFALNRLAWLTYAGPITLNGTSYNSQLDPSYVTALKDSYGFTDAFLLQGTPQNVFNYFGLSWVADPNNSSLKVWVYSHDGTTPLVTMNPSAIPIKTLVGTSNPVQNRDPDFFELLRAAVNTGAITKSSAAPSLSTPGGYQATLDASTNGAVIQIGANIIDQFDLDSYPTRIDFYDPELSQIRECRGVEDLPYFYRLRGSMMKLKESNPSFTSRNNDPASGTLVTGNEGLGAAFQQPEIWNPHTWNPSAATSNLRPTSFRITAMGGLPNITTPPTPDPNAFVVYPKNRYSLPTDWQSCPPTATTGGVSPFKNLSWNQSNTAMTFTIPANRIDLFREPTLLIKPSVPAGSNLAVASTNLVLSESILSPYHNARGVIGVNGVSGISCPFYTSNGTGDNGTYIGFYMGAFPLAWNATVSGLAPTNRICNAFLAGSGSGNHITIRVQYEIPRLKPVDHL
ncbi:MAG: hypothetical protein QM796_21295 [Chthoniobacteraceae bacterium]